MTVEYGAWTTLAEIISPSSCRILRTRQRYDVLHARYLRYPAVTADIERQLTPEEIFFINRNAVENFALCPANASTAFLPWAEAESGW